MTDDLLTLQLANIRSIDVSVKLEELLSTKRSLDLELFQMTQKLVKGGHVNSKDFEALRRRITSLDHEILETSEKAKKQNNLPYIVIDKRDSIPLPKNKKVPTKPGDKQKRVLKKGTGKDILAEEEVKEVLTKNKDALKNAFRFKTVEECKSIKRSQPYYMSKEEIIKTIDENPSIKATMPAKYKTMKKEEICHSLFNNGQKN